MSDVSDEAIAEAIKSVDYKYFGDYPLSDGQWDAVTTLCLAAKALTSARSEIEELKREKAAGEFWRGVFDDIDDKTERDKIAAELSDYRFILEQVPDAYCHVTGGLLSKPNYYATEVKAASDDYSTRLTNEAIEDATKDARSEIARLREALDGFGSDCMTSERHHPGYVLIPKTQFDRIMAARSALSPKER